MADRTPNNTDAADVSASLSPALTRRGVRIAPGLDIEPRGYHLRADRNGTLSLGDARDPSDLAQQVRFGVILPVYNEASLIPLTFHHVHEFAKTHPDFLFLFVDDGSSDSTPAMLRTLIINCHTPGKGHPANIEVLAYTPNAGKGHAVKTGVDAIDTEFVLFTDGDLAYSLDHLLKLADALKSADVVIGSRGLIHRSERNTTTLRRIMGWTFNKCARVVLGLPYSDTQAGLKGFRAKAAREIFAVQRLGGFAFDVELVYLAKRLGFSIAEIPAFVSEEHSYKRSKVNLFRDPLKMFKALLDVRWNAITRKYGRSRKPGANAHLAPGGN